MNIVICGSMSASKEMMEVGKYLEENGHEVVLPKNTDKYAENVLAPETNHESTENKIKNDLIREHFRHIENADAVVVVNVDKGEKKHYIGANSFLEAGFAHVLRKPLYLLNDVEDSFYSDELRAMQPVILYSDISKILN